MSDPPLAPPPPATPTPGRPPGQVQAIAYMTLAGGIVAILVGLGWGFNGLLTGLFTFGIGCLMLFPATFSLILGVMALMKASRLLGSNASHEGPPTTIAIMQIVNIISFDVINVVLGILILVFLNDPDVKRWYRI